MIVVAAAFIAGFAPPADSAMLLRIGIGLLRFLFRESHEQAALHLPEIGGTIRDHMRALVYCRERRGCADSKEPLYTQTNRSGTSSRSPPNWYAASRPPSATEASTQA